MSDNSTRLGRLVAATGALALGVSAAFALGTTAHADGNAAPGQPGAPTSGSLTINKYSGSPVEEGESLEGRTKLNGVEFTVTQVGRLVDGSCTAINLTDTNAWTGLEALFATAPAAPTDPYCLLTEAAVKDVTEAGVVDFDLALGIYYVSETDPGSNHIVSKTPNFYVSIPSSTGESADGWNYHVVADPKNQIIDLPSKTISDGTPDLVLGDTITYTLTVPVPTLNNSETFNSAVITDNLDPRLSYVSSTVTLDGNPLNAGEHFTVDPDGVTWTFTPDGRTELNGAMAKNLVVKLVTSVDTIGNGAIANDDYSSSFNGTVVPGTVEPYTYWGQLTVHKQDNSTTPKALKDAQFKVFPTADDGTCQATAPSTGEIATGTSVADGTVEWEGQAVAGALGIWVANSADGQLEPVPTRNVCLYETKVPAGHSAAAFTNLVTITPGETNSRDLTITNPRRQGPGLPLTGGTGTVLMSLGGIAIVAVGVFALIAGRRKKASA